MLKASRLTSLTIFGWLKKHIPILLYIYSPLFLDISLSLDDLIDLYILKHALKDIALTFVSQIGREYFYSFFFLILKLIKKHLCCLCIILWLTVLIAML